MAERKDWLKSSSPYRSLRQAVIEIAVSRICNIIKSRTNGEFREFHCDVIFSIAFRCLKQFRSVGV